MLPIDKIFYFRFQNKVVNELFLEDLGRKDLNSKLTCKAVNNNISSSVHSSVHLDMTCK